MERAYSRNMELQDIRLDSEVEPDNEVRHFLVLQVSSFQDRALSLTFRPCLIMERQLKRARGKQAWTQTDSRL